MKFLTFLENFYPRQINISWTCGVGKSQEIISSTELIMENPDGTFNVSSEVRISEDLLKDPGFRVQVSWEHESLDKPGRKELSIRDPEYTWNPIVEEIETPTLFYNTPVSLQCNISEYFPDAVTVKWLRRKDQKLYEESGAVSQSNKDTDYTYSCTAKLMITPTKNIHQGAEYICLVEHPSLKKPIERRTGKLNCEDTRFPNHPDMVLEEK
ncbi:H-2 class II histocompatibility antigen, E-D beta chain-like [Mixophyes fleayi]|uniref:H-2 class II histocompatibility antigen, E-D beta chain-like n=1 Tax=Mixophyes fleayi TaxID=3061075 RepID=UPI003F4D9D1A